MHQDLATYYHLRAREYDRVYEIQEEQEDLKRASELFRQLLEHKSVLEIACGTGYWTEQIARAAASIYATDINQSMIDIAASRAYTNQVEFHAVDMYSIQCEARFDACFGGFIWSHIPLQDLDAFLLKLQSMVVHGGPLAFIDSKQVHGSNHDKKRTTRIDSLGNCFQTRQLADGTIHEVLKNFPSIDFLHQKFALLGRTVKVLELEYYWIAYG